MVYIMNTLLWKASVLLFPLFFINDGPNKFNNKAVITLSWLDNGQSVGIIS